MATTNRPDILAADPTEVSERLRLAGLTGVRTSRAAGFLNILSDQGDAAVEAALAGWVPTSSGFDGTPESASWRSGLPPAFLPHAIHLRDYLLSVRSGAQAVRTAAQRQAEAEHVIADLIDAIRLLVDARAAE